MRSKTVAGVAALSCSRHSTRTFSLCMNALTDRGGWQSIPTHLQPFRDQLRIAGFDLIRISTWEAADRARKYTGHSPRDYEYTIYPIAHIDESSGQIYLRGSPESSRYFSENAAPSVVNSHLEQHASVPLRRWLLRWLRDTERGKALAVTTVIAPPYGLTLLAFIGIGNYQELRDARRRAQLLPRMRDKPRFA